MSERPNHAGIEYKGLSATAHEARYLRDLETYVDQMGQENKTLKDKGDKLWELADQYIKEVNNTKAQDQYAILAAEQKLAEALAQWRE